MTKNISYLMLRFLIPLYPVLGPLFIKTQNPALVGTFMMKENGCPCSIFLSSLMSQ